MFKQLAIAAVGSIALLAGSAQAGAFNQGSLSLNNLATDVATDLTIDLSTKPTVFVLDPSAPLALNTGTKDFQGLHDSNIPFGPILDTSNPASFDFCSATIGCFVGTSVTPEVYDPATKALSFDVIGTYTTGTDFTAGSFSGEEALSLTQVGGKFTSINIGGTFFSPASPNLVPEPMTMTLFGAGLAALGLARRKSK